MIEKLRIKTLKEIIEQIKSFERYEVHGGGTEWNCELCGKWRSHAGHGVEHGIYLYNGDEFKGDVICLGSQCINKVLIALEGGDSYQQFLEHAIEYWQAEFDARKDNPDDHLFAQGAQGFIKGLKAALENYIKLKERGEI